MSKKTLKELTLKDNFMFGAVMIDENNCRRLLELILQMPIEKVEVCKEKSIIYHPDNSIVIFICDFDPFGKDKYCYIFENKCKGLPEVNLQDGSKTIFLSTRGKNKSEVSEAMVKFFGLCES